MNTGRGARPWEYAPGGMRQTIQPNWFPKAHAGDFGVCAGYALDIFSWVFGPAALGLRSGWVLWCEPGTFVLKGVCAEGMRRIYIYGKQILFLNIRGGCAPEVCAVYIYSKNNLIFF